MWAKKITIDESNHGDCMGYFVSTTTTCFSTNALHSMQYYYTGSVY